MRHWEVQKIEDIKDLRYNCAPTDMKIRKLPSPLILRTTQKNEV